MIEELFLLPFFNIYNVAHVECSLCSVKAFKSVQGLRGSFFSDLTLFLLSLRSLLSAGLLPVRWPSSSSFFFTSIYALCYLLGGLCPGLVSLVFFIWPVSVWGLWARTATLYCTLFKSDSLPQLLPASSDQIGNDGRVGGIGLFVSLFPWA